MRILHLITPLALLCLLMLQTGSMAQDDLPISVSHSVDFTLVYDSLDLAFETWDQDEAPDTVYLDALCVASGFLAGIPFHYERNRDRMTVTEQVDIVADELEYLGYRIDVQDCYFFDYTVWISSDTYSDAHQGTSVQGHGVSELEDYAEARDEARTGAFEDAVHAAIYVRFTERTETIPGIVDGRITWYEINMDELDPESGAYVFDINAWVVFDEEDEED